MAGGKDALLAAANAHSRRVRCQRSTEADAACSRTGSARSLSASRRHRDCRYAADEEDEHEPGRTERLLTRPLRLWRARRSVAELAGLWFWLDPSGAGLGVYYRFVALAMQCVVAMIVGMGTLMQPGSLAAHAQVWIILLIQAVMFALCIFTSFASDRLDAAFTGLEVAMQATAVLLLYGYNLATEDGTATPAANASMDGLPHRVEDGTREQIESTALILSLSAAYLQLLLCVCLLPAPDLRVVRKLSFRFLL